MTVEVIIVYDGLQENTQMNTKNGTKRQSIQVFSENKSEISMFYLHVRI